MSNLIILCHGAPENYGTISLVQGQSIDYRGNYGSPLGDQESAVLVAMLLDNPTVIDDEIRRAIPNYRDPSKVEGPASTNDFNLSGDDDLFCALINMTTRKAVRLGGDRKFRLRDIADPMKHRSFWINLVCCANIPGAGVPRPVANKDIQFRAWGEVVGNLQND